MWVRVVLTTLVLLAVTWAGVALEVFHHGGTWLIWVSVLLMVVAVPFVARDRMLVVLGVFAAGLHLVMIFGAGPALVGGVVLTTRGEQVQATVTGYTDSWTSAQFDPPSKYTRHALAVVTPDGQHGIVADDGNRPGDRVTVVADPRGGVDPHRPDEVDFGVGLGVAAVDLLMVFGLSLQAGRTWRKATTEVFPSKREGSDHELG